MKKRLSLLLVAVFGLTVFMSGCNLFAVDKNAYYNQVVASVALQDGTKTTNIQINKEELMQAYNRYYDTLNNSGYSGKALIDYLVNLLIDQKIVINEVTKMIASGQITFANNDKNEVWTNTYDNMVSLIGDYAKTVADDWNIPTPADGTSTDATKETFKEFEPTAKLVKVQNTATGAYEWKIQVLDGGNKEQKPLVYDETEGVVNTVSAKLAEYVAENPVLVEAKKRYIYALKNYQSGRNMPTKDAEIWQGEIERVYKSVLDNKYLTMYSKFLEKSTADGEKVYSAISVQDVFKFLENKMKSNYTKYTTNPTAFNEDMLNNRANAYYVMKDHGADDYFYVSHILVKFADGIFTTIDELKKSGQIDNATYNNMRANLIAGTKVKSYGETVDSMTVGQFYDFFQEQINAQVTTQDKLRMFNEIMYEYNEDTGNKNKDYDYVIGAKDSKMVESFTKASRDLFNNGNGQIGDISGMVESEYGIHIIMYLGQVESVFNITDIDTFSLTTQTGADLDANVARLTSAKLSALNTKTMFDVVYSQLSTDSVAILETLNLNKIKHDAKITKFPKTITDLY